MERSFRIRPGFVAALLAGLGLVAWLSIPTLGKARGGGAENEVVGALRTIHTAQDVRLTGAVAHGRPVRYDHSLEELAELSRAGGRDRSPLTPNLLAEQIQPALVERRRVGFAFRANWPLGSGDGRADS